jgi:hypothetical protein
MTGGTLEDRFAEPHATRDTQPELPPMTAPVSASDEYAPANLREQGQTGQKWRRYQRCGSLVQCDPTPLAYPRRFIRGAVNNTQNFAS